MSDKRQREVFGLIGTITQDRIKQASGRSFKGWGGILYQAAVFSGLGCGVRLFSKIGKKEVLPLAQTFQNWPRLDICGLRKVDGPSNQVRLNYPPEGERIEILESVVPPQKAHEVFEHMAGVNLLMLVMNSGFDISLGEWKKIVNQVSCPVWIDIHSLVLSRVFNIPRLYRSFTEWREWASGSDFLQANRKEAACMMGSPDKTPSHGDICRLSREALETGVKAFFITLGTEGVWTAVEGRMEYIPPPKAKKAVDTTGCGDVFGAATAVHLLEKGDPFSAAVFGMEKAADAAVVAGVEAVHKIFKKGSVHAE
ncbi:MAG: hypothetical protein JXB26_14185 [Candidatus Aminicenantes bacterium]|nr:hypothetical protein [Candidatus Aminicenantes bacterium]